MSFKRKINNLIIVFLGVISAFVLISVFLDSYRQDVYSTVTSPEVSTSENAVQSISLVKTASTRPDCGNTITEILSGLPYYFCYSVSNPSGPAYLTTTVYDNQVGIFVTRTSFAANATQVFTRGPLIEPVFTSPATKELSSTAQVQGVVASNNNTDIQNVNYIFRANAVNATARLKKTITTVANSCAVSSATTLTVTQNTTVYYCYELENIGNISITTQSLIDDKLGAIPFIPATLPPGVKYTTVFTLAPALITTTNVATWSVISFAGLPFSIPVTSDSKSATLNVKPLEAKIVLTKTVGTLGLPDCGVTNVITVTQGVPVYYCYTITNTGDVSVTNVSLVDDKISSPFTLSASPILPGETKQVKGIAATLSTTTTNVATWTVQSIHALLSTTTFAQSLATVNVLPPSPNMSIVKTLSLNASCTPSIDPLTVGAGTPVYYCYTMSNTGSFSLTTTSLIDNDFPGLTAPVSVFQVGANSTFTAGPVTKNTASTYNSTVTWNANYFNPSINTLSASDNAQLNIDAAVPAMVVTKTVGIGAGGCATTNVFALVTGNSAIYCYTVKNTGNVALSTFSINDSHIGIFTPTATLLQPGNTVSFLSGAFTPSATGVIVATGTVNAVGTVGGNISASSVTTLSVTLGPPSIQLLVGVKTTPECTVSDTIYVASGTSVYYCFTVRNTSTTPQTLTNHSLSTQLFGNVFTNVNVSLAPGATYTYLHPVPAVIVRTLTTNNSTWTATISDVVGVSASATENATACLSGVIAGTPCHLVPTSVPPTPTATPTSPAPVVDLVANLNSVGKYAIGSVMTITFTVNNAGNLAANSVTLIGEIPANTSVKAVNTNGLTCSSVPTIDGTGGNLVCSVPGGLPANASRNMSVVIQPANLIDAQVTFSVSTSMAEPNIGNNSATLPLGGRKIFVPVLLWAFLVITTWWFG
jgi:hypothetical protein